MKVLTAGEIPKLPTQAIVCDEMIAFGVFEVGVVIQYIEKDKCVFFDWDDVVRFCIELERVASKKQEEPVEIEKPTEV